MDKYFFYYILFFILIIVINQLLLKFKILNHKKLIEHHKKFGKENVPLSGGIFFLSILIYLKINYGFLNNNYFFFIFLFFILGLLTDLNFNINAKLRFLFQLFFTVLLVYCNNLLVLKTNLNILDYFLQNSIFSIFFSCFCIMVVLNGINFLDGVNNNVIGFSFYIFFSIFIIEIQNNILGDEKIYLLLLISVIIFYIFNFFSKSYLGDSGVYILSTIISVMTILFINNSPYVSPILAVNFLWYPAYETLFSIIRKLVQKKNPFNADIFHFHTLILRYFSNLKIKNSNSLSGFLINFFLLPNFLIAINFYNNSKVLFLTTVCYLILYTFIYLKIYHLINKKN